MPNSGASLLPRTSKVRLSTPRDASAVRNLVNLLHHELALRPVSWTLSVVGIALSPTVGPQAIARLCPFCWSSTTHLVDVCCRLLVLAASHSDCPSLSRRCLFSCSSCITVLRRRFTRALALDVSVLTHMYHSSTRFSTCCAWKAGCSPATLSSARRAWSALLLWVMWLACESETCGGFARVTPATAYGRVDSTAVAAVWAWTSYVAIPFVVQSVRRATRRCDRASWSM